MMTSSRRRFAVTAAALTVFTTGITLASPAYAAAPALAGGGYVKARFVVDTGTCSVTGHNSSDEAKVSVPTSGSRSFTSRTSGKLTATDPAHASDKVTMTGAGLAKGSARGAGGAFVSLSATLSATATLSTSLASTVCSPLSSTTAGSLVNARVKKPGTITVKVTVRDGGSAEVFVGPAGALAGADISTLLRPGTYTVSYPVRPGLYLVAVGLEADAGTAAPFKTTKASTSATVSATYRAR